MQVKVVSATVLAAVLALATGCGSSSSSSDTFKKSYQSITTQLQQTSAAIGSAIQGAPSKTDAQIHSTFQALATRWQNQLSQLSALKPPSDLAAKFNTLTSAAGRVESDLSAIVAAAAIHSKTNAEQAAASLVNDAVATRSADAPIRQKLGLK